MLPSNAVTASTYAEVEAVGYDARFTAGADGVIHPAAASILSNWLANSHGGGHVPNVHLRGAVGWLLWRGLVQPSVVRYEVGRARARDWHLGDGPAATFMLAWTAREYAEAWRIALRRG